MKTLRASVLFFALGCVAFLGLAAEARSDTIVLEGDTYAAIAYSPATGKVGYGYNYDNRWSAEAAALRNCKADDARIVTWVNNGFCALAVGDDKSTWGVGYSYGDGASTTYARQRALQEAGKRTKNVHVTLCICSSNAMTPQER